MKAIVTFANNELLELESGDVIVEISKANGAFVAGNQFKISSATESDFLLSLLTILSGVDYFFASSNWKKIYASKYVVSIESK